MQRFEQKKNNRPFRGSHAFFPELRINIWLDKADRQKTRNRTETDPQEEPAVSRRSPAVPAEPGKRLLNHSGHHPHKRHSKDRKPRHKREVTCLVFTAPVRKLHHKQNMRHITEPVTELFQRNARS